MSVNETEMWVHTASIDITWQHIYWDTETFNINNNFINSSAVSYSTMLSYTVGYRHQSCYEHAGEEQKLVTRRDQNLL